VPTPADLVRRFARRMAPAALLAGLSLALLPPLAHLGVHWSSLEEQAGTYAAHFAATVKASAELRPRLWRYDLPKMVLATAGYQGQRDIAQVRVLDCGGAAAIPPEELGVGTGFAWGPRGARPIWAHGRRLGQVQVVMDPRPPIGRALRLAGLSSLLGLALSLFLYRYPRSVLRRQSSVLAATLERLAAAEARLTLANADLARQVAGAVAEVRRLSQRVVGAQEQERLRVARELHDGAGQALTGLRLQLELALAGAQGAAQAALDRGLELVDAALAELRHAVTELRPPALERLGLAGALRNLCEDFERHTRVPCALRVQGTLDDLPPGAAQALYRIVQEGLTNVARHAQASEVGLRIRRDERGLTLQLEDDGRGCDEPAALGRGSGLQGIAERARFLGGSAQLRTTPGEGACLELSLPPQALEPEARDET